LVEDRFRVILIDFPGLGDTDFDERRPLGFGGLAELIRSVTDHLELQRYSIVAHDTGGTIARLVAAAEPSGSGRWR
jgi:pimeloyl-ACP methyl ester carboxylesterase